MRKTFLIVVALTVSVLMVAACSPAPTAVPTQPQPTDAPPQPVATAVPPTLSPAATATTVPPTAAPASATAVLPTVAQPTAPPPPVTSPGLYVTPIPTAPLWRFGVARARRPMTDYNPIDVASMRFGWYVDWGAGSSPLSQFGMDYVPMIRVRQVKLKGSSPINTPCQSCPYATPYTYTVSLNANQIQSKIASLAGKLWIIGNEMERLDWGDCSNCGQDEIVPELYARAYHDVYSTIKAADSTAQVAIGGMVEATPLRLEYLDRVWAAYSAQYGQPMPVDVWNIHVFVLQELRNSWGAEIPAGLTESSGMPYSVYDNKNFSLAVSQLVTMRTWMKNHGQQDKPLIITEYGVNMPTWWCDSSGCPFTSDQVRDNFMYPSFNYFLSAVDCNLSSIDSCHLVQRWNWWSFDDDSLDSNGQQAYNGNLFYSGLPGTNPQGVSTLGLDWRQYVQSLPPAAAKPY